MDVGKSYRTFVLTAAVLAAAAIGLSPAPSPAAGLLIADGGFGGVLETKEHDVKVTINNGVAVTEVTQVFVNTENRVVEALYTFPVPNSASVANFSMWINGKEMIGEVVEKQRAREIYESYKRTRRDPGLLEQVDYKRFEMRIFPIAAGAEQRVKIEYYQELDFDHDWATYVYPLSTVSQTGLDEATTGRFSCTLEVKSEVPIVKMQSPSHGDQFVVARHTDNYHQASLEAHGGDLSRDIVIAYHVERPHTGVDLITSKEPTEDGYFLLTFTAGKELAELNKGMDYVFILDVSGSMAHDGKLRLSRESLAAFVESLGAEDRFEVMTFNVQASTLFGDLAAAGDETKRQAGKFLDSQQARGGTMLAPAVNAAYGYRDADRTLNVVILSDGMTEQAESRQLAQLIASRPSGSRVFSIGVGNEVNRPLLRQLAEEAGGLAAFISHGDDFQRQAQAFRRKLMRPAASNVKITFDGADVYDVQPSHLPDLYHGAPVRMYGRYRTGGTVKVSIDADVMGAPLSQTAQVELPKDDPRNPQIERMWAWHQVQELTKKVTPGSSNQPVVDEILRLCEGYSITSPYASFIVLENDGEYRRWKIERRNVTRIQRDRQAQARLRAELDALRAAAQANIGPGRNEDDPTRQLASADQTPPIQNAPARPAPVPADGQSFDFTPSGGGGGGGGGAIDPITGMIVLGLAGAGAWAARRRREEGR